MNFGLVHGMHYDLKSVREGSAAVVSGGNCDASCFADESVLVASFVCGETHKMTDRVGLRSWGTFTRIQYKLIISIKLYRVHSVTNLISRREKERERLYVNTVKNTLKKSV